MTSVQEQPQERFADRRDAGRRLAGELAGRTADDAVVVALPRGGVPVGREVADALGLPLEILAVRKLAPRHHPEYGIGAVAEDGTCVIDPEASSVLRILNGEIGEIAAAETAELRRRVEVYRAGRRAQRLRDREAIVVDDGVATGVTDTAALRAVRHQHPRRLVLAVPVCSPEALERLREEADEVICLQVPRLMRSVGQWYEDFSQVSDEEVLRDLRAAGHATA